MSGRLTIFLAAGHGLGSLWRPIPVSDRAVALIDATTGLPLEAKHQEKPARKREDAKEVGARL